MRIAMLGVNHRTADVALRERLALSEESTALLGRRMTERFEDVQFVLLCTCNRTEIYLAHRASHNVEQQQLVDLLAEACGLSAQEFAPCTIWLRSEQAATHLFRVAAGLDSMVLGEPQILGQVKKAYEQAIAAQTVGPVIHKLFQSAIATAKQVRTKTRIGQGHVSVGSVAVDLAKQIFERFEDKTVLAIGAGEMIKIALRHFLALSPAKLWIANRTLDHARHLATVMGIKPPRGGARPMQELQDALVEADIVIACTGSPTPIIHGQMLRSLRRARQYRPLFLIDIAVPRDVAPDAANVQDVYLYNLDHIEKVIGEAQHARTDDIDQAHEIIHQSVVGCVNEIQHRDIGQLVGALREKLHQLGHEEHHRTLGKLLAAQPERYEELLQQHTHRLINKILHLPLSQLDRRDSHTPLGFYASALEKLFHLEIESDAQERQDDNASDEPAKSSNDPIHADKS